MTMLKLLLSELGLKDWQPMYIEDSEEHELGLPIINSKHVREGEIILTDNRYAYLLETHNPLTIQSDKVRQAKLNYILMKSLSF